jgi:MOSC domain-containing protein YiiM
MQHVGTVLSLFISSPETSELTPKKVVEVDLSGIQEDKHYNQDVERSILITSTSSYDLVAAHEIHIPFGTLGENILVDFNPYHLPIGTRLHMGNSILEITQNCTLCKHLAVHDKRIPKLLKKDRGIFAKVVVPGQIKTGDTVSIVPKTV